MQFSWQSASLWFWLSRVQIPSFTLICTLSSAGQSAGLRIRRSQVRILQGVKKKQRYLGIELFNNIFASVVKLVDTLDLGSSASRCEGSSPSARKRFFIKPFECESSSVVELHLAKVDVAGSTPVFRSKLFSDSILSNRFFFITLFLLKDGTSDF